MKTNLIIALLLVSSIVIAQNTEEKFQIPKHQWTIGGNVNFNSRNSESENISASSKFNFRTIGIKPEVGYAISNNLILGLGAGYSFSKNENETSESVNQSRTLSITSFLRKYFPLNERFAFSIQGELTFSDNESKTKNDGVDVDSSVANGHDFFVGFRPGLTYSLTNKIYLNANMGILGFTKSKWENEDNIARADYFDFNLGTSNLTVGLLILL